MSFGGLRLNAPSLTSAAASGSGSNRRRRSCGNTENNSGNRAVSGGLDRGKTSALL
jgi:hypothetical protein